MLASLLLSSGQVEVQVVAQAAYSAGARVGCSAAILDDVAVVGACEATSSSGHTSAGMVHMLSVGTRAPLALVNPPRAVASALFGSSVALGKSRGQGTLVVGAPGESQGFRSAVGFVYVFRFAIGADPTGSASGASGASGTSSAPSFVLRLNAEDGGPEDHFGSSVAVHGDTCVVGARGADYYPAGRQTIEAGGAAYVFDLQTGDQLAMLQPRDAMSGASPMLGCYWFGASVAIAEGVILVGAPRARRPCAPATRAGAAFAFRVPSGGEPLRFRQVPWWWGDGPTYNQTSYLVPPDSSGNLDFGTSVAIAPTAWRAVDGGEDSVFLIGAPGATNERGAVYITGMFNHSESGHPNSETWLRRVNSPASLGSSARFGASVAVEGGSGLAVIGAPGGFTQYGRSGVAIRSWIVRDAITGQLDPDAPLTDVSERLVWGPDADSGDSFGTSVAVAASGHVLVGASAHAHATNVSSLSNSGAAYIFDPVLTSPSQPPPLPPSPPPPHVPGYFAPPSAPNITIVYEPSQAFTYIGMSFIFLGSLAGLLALLYPWAYPKRWRKLTRRCRKNPPTELVEDEKRGSVADQLRAILAEQADKIDVFKAWDRSGGGTVSRKEFRNWWLKIGYEVPDKELNDLFDEVCVLPAPCHGCCPLLVLGAALSLSSVVARALMPLSLAIISYPFPRKGLCYLTV